MLDPQSRWVLDLVRRAARPPFHHLSPALARRQFDATMAALEVRPVPVAEVTDIRLPGLRPGSRRTESRCGSIRPIGSGQGPYRCRPWCFSMAAAGPWGAWTATMRSAG